ncbi:uncharacterized protein TEOVI_000745000 [Trypanosoma equiperdum]|uniref:Uncharacterized protein n=1 Tax=Trypanosoma equiperdum TaxID=5694 RepID=A0A1G4I501_TRYEQ|nr:hypothetical protein, conserved [Trypanosoma equiperdum]
MECVSQSLTSYSLLRCIVSAAQFAGGELSFGAHCAELIAMDVEGETTTPLRIHYDDLIHFRVVREQQLMRIELPRVTVQKWAESNGFALELGAGDDGHAVADGGRYEGTCALVQQLSVDDMAHFLQCIAPVVAASRRTRSLSRVSITEALPLSYCPQNPDGTEVVSATESSSRGVDCESDGEGSCDNSKDEDCNRPNSVLRDGAAASDKDNSHCPSVSLLSAPKPGRPSSASASLSQRASCSAETGSTQREPMRHTRSDRGLSTTTSALSERKGATVEANEKLLCRLESVDLSSDASGAKFSRASTVQRSQLLACEPSRLGGGGDKEKEETEAIPGAASVCGESEAAASDMAILVRKSRPKKGRSSTEGHLFNTEKCVKDDPTALDEDPQTPLKRGKRVRGRPAPQTRRGQLVVPLSLQEATVSVPPPAAERPPRGKECPTNNTVPFKGTPASALLEDSKSSGNADNNSATEAAAAYNFADVITAPSAADHLPVTSDTHKLLADLHAVLPGRRRPTAKRAGTRQQPSRRPTAKGRTKAISTAEATKVATPPPKATALTTQEKHIISPKAPARTASRNPSFDPIKSPVPYQATTGSAASEYETPLINPRAFYLSREAHREPSPLAQDVQNTDVSNDPHDNQPQLPGESLLNGCTDSAYATQKAGRLPSGQYSFCTLSPLSEYHVDASLLPPTDNIRTDVGATLGNASPSTACTETDETSGLFRERGKFVSPKGVKGQKRLKTKMKRGGVHMRPPTPGTSSVASKLHRHHLYRTKRRGGSASPPLASAAAIVTATTCAHSRKNRWRQVVRQLNNLSLCLTKARACGEELRGLFLLMLEDAEI